LTIAASDDENRTVVGRMEEFEPYHTFFATPGDEKWRGKVDEEALRGISGNLLDMDVDSARNLAERRRRRRRSNSRSSGARNDGERSEDATTGGDEDDVGGGSAHRRLEEEEEVDIDADANRDENEVGGGEVDGNRDKQEGVADPEVDAGQDTREGVVSEADANQDKHEEDGSEVNVIREEGEVGEVARDTIDEGIEKNDVATDAGEAYKQYQDDYMSSEEGLFDDAIGAPPDGTESAETYSNSLVDDAYLEHEPNGDNADSTSKDDHYYRDYGMDDYHYRKYGRPRKPPDGWDTYEQYQTAKDQYYHDSNYMHLPPHLLSTCSLVELQRTYGSYSTPEDKVDELVLCAVSYFFDEDECKDPSKSQGKSFGKHANAGGGDETEEQRGRYLASAVMAYNLRLVQSIVCDCFCICYSSLKTNAISRRAGGVIGRFKKCLICPQIGHRLLEILSKVGRQAFTRMRTMEVSYYHLLSILSQLNFKTNRLCSGRMGAGNSCRCQVGWIRQVSHRSGNKHGFGLRAGNPKRLQL
jgi:hypothetical protein